MDWSQDIIHHADKQSNRDSINAEVFHKSPKAAVNHISGNVPRQVTGPVDHRDQGSDGDADQAEFQDEGDCGHEVKDGFDNRTRLEHQEGKAALIRCWGKRFAIFAKKNDMTSHLTKIQAFFPQRLFSQVISLTSIFL